MSGVGVLGTCRPLRSLSAGLYWAPYLSLAGSGAPCWRAGSTVRPPKAAFGRRRRPLFPSRRARVKTHEAPCKKTAKWGSSPRRKSQGRELNPGPPLASVRPAVRRPLSHPVSDLYPQSICVDRFNAKARRLLARACVSRTGQNTVTDGLGGPFQAHGLRRSALLSGTGFVNVFLRG